MCVPINKNASFTDYHEANEQIERRGENSCTSEMEKLSSEKKKTEEINNEDKIEQKSVKFLMWTQLFKFVLAQSKISICKSELIVTFFSFGETRSTDSFTWRRCNHGSRFDTVESTAYRLVIEQKVDKLSLILQFDFIVLWKWSSSTPSQFFPHFFLSLFALVVSLYPAIIGNWCLPLFASD